MIIQIVSESYHSNLEKNKTASQSGKEKREKKIDRKKTSIHKYALSFNSNILDFSTHTTVTE